jgi:hypothetical protein
MFSEVELCAQVLDLPNEVGTYSYLGSPAGILRLGILPLDVGPVRLDVLESAVK